MTEMTTGENGLEKSDDSQNGEPAAEVFLSELAALSWSVVSFEKCEAGDLTYEQAEEKMRELAALKVSGLCIITDEAAGRLGRQK